MICSNSCVARTRVLAALAALSLVAAAAPRAAAQGSLVAWGSDTAGVVSGVPAGTFVAVAAGSGHAVAIREDGTLVSWGDDSVGQVSGTPAGTFVSVAACGGHNVAIRTDGTLVAWGSGDGAPAGTFVAVATGYIHGVAIRTDGTLASWGDDWYAGQVRDTPAGTFSAVAAGFDHSVAIRTDGTLAIWGYHYFGPVGPAPSGTFSAVAGGLMHSVAIRTDGTLVAWGDPQTYWGPIVNDTPAGAFFTIAASDSHSVAIRTDGTLVSWGDGPAVSGTPAGTYSAVAAGPGFSVAISADPNEPALATDDFYGVTQASVLNVAAPGVLANDTDADEDPLSAELVAGPAYAASFQLNPDGSFGYAPVAWFAGDDFFSYRANDGEAYSEIVTVRITVSQPGSDGFITGGGRLIQNDRTCTFGFLAKVTGAGVQGQLAFQDHGANVDVTSEALQSVYAGNQTDGQFGGTCRVNGVGGYTFFVQVHDGGPGGTDELELWVLDSFNTPVYTAGAPLAGGNIVIHGN